MTERKVCSHGMTFAPQMKRGLILSAVLGLTLLATAFIPHLKQVPSVKQEEVRPVHPPSAIHMVPQIVTGELTIVNYLHRAVSVQGVAADQTYRMFAAIAFLGFYVMRILSSNRAVRAGLAAFSLLGAAGCVHDVLSYWLLGGVVDWIGVNGHSAFAPSDLCLCLAPIGIPLIVSVGVATFNADSRPSGAGKAAKKEADGPKVASGQDLLAELSA
jgi:hypothetical protein